MPPDQKNTLWQDQARKLGGDSLVEVITGMAEDINGMKGKIEVMDKHILKAFPGGDLEGHRRYHELMIRRTDEIRSLRIAIAEKTLTGLLWSGMAFLGWAILEAVKKKLGL